jgi:cation diffusion facilitator CzcD-associated flavoprotein CzcO
VPSNLYRCSFKSYDWTRTHARQPELQAYLEETVDEFDLRPHVQLGVTVESATWDDDRHLWTIRLDTGSVIECHVIISAVGFLNVPRYPDWPGLDEFEGPKFHASRWEHQHDLGHQVLVDRPDLRTAPPLRAVGQRPPRRVLEHRDDSVHVPGVEQASV